MSRTVGLIIKPKSEKQKTEKPNGKDAVKCSPKGAAGRCAIKADT